MATKVNRDSFERMAFEAALREHPNSTAAQGAFRDYLHENGYTWIGAGRVMLGIVREELAKRTATEMQTVIDRDGELGSFLRGRCRLASGTGTGVVASIEVVPGKMEPVRVGDLGYYEDERGAHVSGVHAPLPPDRVWTWVDGPVRIAVGGDWLKTFAQNAAGSWRGYAQYIDRLARDHAAAERRQGQ